MSGRLSVPTVAELPVDGQRLATGVGWLVALSVWPGLGLAGWLAGVGYLVGLCVLLTLAVRRAGLGTLGPAGQVTLARAVLVGCVTALVVDGLARTPAAPGSVLALVGTASAALALDVIDGAVARRTGTASALGARFDMEVDAFLILVLSAHVAGLLGWWVLAIGAMRYVFGGVRWALGTMSRAAGWRSAVPPRFSARVIAATQGIVLVVASAGVLSRVLATAAVAVALALLVWSFAQDARWLRRRAGREGGVAVAGGVVLLALLAPSQLGQLTAGVLARIPLDGLLAGAVLLVLPARARRVAAALLGVALGLLAVLKLLDLGFSAALARPFHPVTDGSLFAAAAGFVAASIGQVAAVAAVVAAVVLAVAVPVLMARSVLRLSRLATAHREAAARVLAVLACGWGVCALLGAQLAPGLPVASWSTAALARDAVAQVGADLRDRETFSAEGAVDPFRDTPDSELLVGLRGKDVALVFVESYGRSAVEDPGLAPGVDAVLDEGTRRLAAAGYGARSGFLTSSTAGGGSWLAHATLLSGLWVDNQPRYRDLVASRRMSLTDAFHRAGYRTVGIMPGLTADWPEGAYYRYDRVYDADHLGYWGPQFSFAPMPDQYTLSAFERFERRVPGRGPLMATIPLISSHAPWSPLPRMIGWDAVGDGSVFDPMAGPVDVPKAILTRDPGRVRADYRAAVEYSLTSLVSYLETYGTDNLVLIFLGDHQPSPIVTGTDAGRDVPITIVARDSAVLRRVSDWGWDDGLRPGPRAPVWRMDAFRDRFLTAFGPRLAERSAQAR